MSAADEPKTMYTAKGANTLRGGKNVYTTGTLEGNWCEDRYTPGKFGGRPHAQTEEAQRQAAVTGKRLPTYGAPVLDELDGMRRQKRYNYNNLIQPDMEESEACWRSTTQGSFCPGGSTAPLADTGGHRRVRKHPIAADRAQRDEYSKRWATEVSSAAQQRFTTTQRLAEQPVVAPRYRAHALRPVRGVPKSVERLRDRITEKLGLHALTLLRREFEMMDDSGDGRLSKEELRAALHDSDIHTSVDEFEELFTYLDRDGSGGVDWKEFMHSMVAGETHEAPHLSERRERVLYAAYESLRRKAPGGSVRKGLLRRQVDMRRWPEVGATRSQEEATALWLAGSAACARKHSDAEVSEQEFFDLYEPISAAVRDDDDFVVMVADQWHLDGFGGSAGRLPRLEVLVTHPGGHKSVEEVEMGPYFNREDEQGIKDLLAEQGIEAHAISLDF